MRYNNGYTSSATTDDDYVPEPGKVEVEFNVEGISDFPLQPTIVDNVEYDIVSVTESHMDQCGYSETDRVGDMGVDLEFNGLVTKTQADALKEARLSANQMEVTTDLHTSTVSGDRGGMYIDTMTLTEHSDQNYIEYTENGETVKETVFSFNLKLTAEESDQ